MQVTITNNDQGIPHNVAVLHGFHGHLQGPGHQWSGDHDLHLHCFEHPGHVLLGCDVHPTLLNGQFIVP